VINKHGNSHNVSYFDRLDDNNNYRLGAGLSSRGRPSADAYYTRYGDTALVTASASHIQGENTSASLSFQGGATLTPKGGAFHRTAMPGAARLLVDTNGVSGVPVRSLGAVSYTNAFGKAVLPDINNYYRNSATIDLDKLPDDVDAVRSIQQLTLTEGAIGYREFDVIAGQKAMAIVRLKDGTYPPFGASITTTKGRELGIVNDSGNVYLSGINSGDILDVRWSGKKQCTVQVPKLDEGYFISSLLLTCGATPSTSSPAEERTESPSQPQLVKTEG
ncbi:fimbria/pilus outer membrane usher protein, partial [Proteus terrae]